MSTKFGLQSDGSFTLPLSASRGQIAQAIETVQSRARTRLAEAMSLADTVAGALEKVDVVAAALEAPIHTLRPHGTFWDGGSAADDAQVTLVELNVGAIYVRRGRRSLGTSNGRVTLTVCAAGGSW